MAIFLVVIFFIAKPAAAGFMVKLVGSLAQAAVSALWLILIQVIGILIKIASYNEFIKEPAVTNGWVIVRYCQHVLVIILLVIAFMTILRIERYNYKNGCLSY